MDEISTPVTDVAGRSPLLAAAPPASGGVPTVEPSFRFGSWLRTCLDASPAQWIWFFVWLGVGLRIIRFLLPFPLWCDEYQLSENLLDRDFTGLLSPLRNNQVAPVGFLWAEKASTLLFGFREWSLRLFPLVCGIAGLFVMRRLATRLLTGPAQIIAVAVLAVSYYPIRLAAEVKPYAGDLLCALTIVLCLVEWHHDARRSRWLWVLAALIGPMLWFSFPAVFAGGAASFALAAVLWQDWRSGQAPNRGTLAAAVGFHLLLLAGFGSVLALNAAQQYQATASDMTACWAEHFPPITRPAALIPWLLDAHTGVIFAYPLGAEHGGSVLTALGCLLGAVHTWRMGRRWWLAWGAGAFALTFVAAALHRYPYGGHARLAQHLVPAILLTLAVGVGALIEALKSVEFRRVAFGAAIAGCLLVAVGTTLRDVARPFKSRTDSVHQGFARWFWNSNPEVVTLCVADDLGEEFYSDIHWSPYRCYREIYRQRKVTPEAARQVVAEGTSPLRCVVFHSHSSPCDRPALNRWLEGLGQRYTLVGSLQHQVRLADGAYDSESYRRLCYDVYEFVPRQPGSAEPARNVPLAADLPEAIRR
ncbi:MAG: glycosyltransferase family 39 protein [Planctomycetaceae bacterium]